jgi:hypothetical protein
MNRLEKAKAIGGAAGDVAALMTEAPARGRRPPAEEAGEWRSPTPGLPDYSAAPPDTLIRIGITIPQSVLDAAGEAKYVLQRGKRKVSVSALFEVAMRELLLRDAQGVAAAVDRHEAKARRDSPRSV